MTDAVEEESVSEETGKVEGVARVTYEPEYGYQVWAGDEKLEAYMDEPRANLLRDKIKRSVGILTRKAALCERMAVHLRRYKEEAGRMRDGWAEGDQEVKNMYWKNLHALENVAMDLLSEFDREAKQ